jgi:hypothetical protein
MNHVQRILNRMNDPSTPREEYMRLWEEWNDIVRRQKCIDEEVKRRGGRAYPANQFKQARRGR